MSLRIMSMVWETHCGSHAAKLVLLALADNANDNGVAWPSLETLARKCDLSRRSVIDQLAKLETAGYISRKTNQGKVTVYRILTSANVAPLTSAGNARVADPDQCKPCTSTRAADALAPVQTSHQPVQALPPNHHEPSLEPTHPPRVAGFPQRETVIDYCRQLGWPEESGLQFWLHLDSQADQISPRFRWWSRLEAWVLKDAAYQVATGTRPTPGVRATTPRTSVPADQDKAEKFANNQW